MDGVRDAGRVFRGPPVVRYRRFGASGPVYEVVTVFDATARIRLVESGETLDYPIGRIEADPAA